LVPKEEELEIEIPYGVLQNNHIVYTHMGDCAPLITYKSQQPGNLLVSFNVQLDDKYDAISVADLLTKITITPIDACLGIDDLSLDTISGKAFKVKVPAGTEHGNMLRLKGQGMPISDNAFGNLLVQVEIKVPAEITQEERILLEQLREMPSFKQK
jgi:molecular chaperone DnaJ